eukprot:7340029-Prymnesium_polylepis.1
MLHHVSSVREVASAWRVRTRVRASCSTTGCRTGGCSSQRRPRGGLACTGVRGVRRRAQRPARRGKAMQTERGRERRR